VPRPHDQPVRAAIALAVLSAISLLIAAGIYAAALLGGQGLQEQVLADGAGGAFAAVLLISLAVILISLGAGLAAFVLSIVVVVKGTGKLRLGAALMIAASLSDLVVSFSTSGDVSQLPEVVLAVSNAFSVLQAVVDVIGTLLALAGLVILVLGIREVRRERAAASAR
jgi:hypothetical protein